MTGSQQRSWWGQAIAAFQLQHTQAHTWKDFDKKLREARKVLKVHLLSLLKKRLFSSSLFLFPPPSPTQIPLHKAAFLMFPFVQEPSRPDPRSVEMNERARTSGPFSSSFGWTQAAAPALGSRDNGRKLAAHGAHAELGGEVPKLHEPDCHWEITDEPTQNRILKCFSSLQSCILLMLSWKKERGGFLRGLIWRMHWKTELA